MQLSAEKTVICQLLLAPPSDVWRPRILRLDPKCFKDRDLRVVFETALDEVAHDRIATVYSVGKRLEHVVAHGSKTYQDLLAEITSGLVLHRDVELAVRYLRQDLDRRALCAGLRDVGEQLESGASDVAEAISAAKVVLASALARLSPSEAAFASYGQSFFDESSPPTIATGMPALDDRGFALPIGELTVIAGRPSVGKSAFLLTLCAHQIRAGKRVLYVGLEMSERAVFSRILACLLDVPFRTLFHNELSAQDRDRLKARVGELFSENGSAMLVKRTNADVLLTSVDARLHDGSYDVVYIDYLQLLYREHRNPRENRNQEIGRILSQIGSLAGEHRVPMVVASQLNRDMSRENRKPDLHDLRDSGEIEQAADTVIMLHCPPGAQGLFTREVARKKGRNSGTIEWFPLNFRPETASFIRDPAMGPPKKADPPPAPDLWGGGDEPEPEPGPSVLETDSREDNVPF